MFGKRKDPEKDPKDSMEQKDQNENFSDRRQYKRIERGLILTYSEKDDPSKKYEITQLKNISKGGMCFITSQPIEQSKILIVELKTPYFTHATFLEGVVLESHVKAEKMLYQTRLQFQNMDIEKGYVIEKLLELIEKEGTEHEHS